jgi:hypothetical protein
MSRPILAAVQAQQQQIEVLAEQNNLLRHEVIVLKSQLHHMAEVAGLGQHMAAIRKKADINNPAQPVPAPPSEPAFETTEQALAPETMDNVQNPGIVPGSVNNLAADGHDVPYNPGTSLETPAFNELVNVEAPVAGTETQRPLPETKTLVDVRVGDPMNLEKAFPLTPAFSSMRTMASIRLARLQIEAGIATGDDLSLGEHIAASDKSDEAINEAIEMLSSVRKAANKQRPAGVVPRSAGVARTTPSLTSEASLSVEAAGEDSSTDEDLFLD